MLIKSTQRSRKIPKERRELKDNQEKLMTNSGVENDKTTKTKHKTKCELVFYSLKLMLIMFILLTNNLAYYFMMSAGLGSRLYFICNINLFLFTLSFHFQFETMKFKTIFQLINTLT